MAPRIAVTVLLILLAVYGGIKAIPLLIGPSIRIDAPAEGATLPDGTMTISGTTSHTQTLSLNGMPFLIDEKGHFIQTLLLPHGGAILSLTATDRFGRTRNIRRSVFVP